MCETPAHIELFDLHLKVTRTKFDRRPPPPRVRNRFCSGLPKRAR
jgi:hypothetical protein